MTREKSEKEYTGLEIAVIGMAGRFPGAKNIHEFWENLKNGVESISFFTLQELEQSGVDPLLLENPNYIKAYGILEEVEYFDSNFFDYTPMEAGIMDPQVRIFHECAWSALEDAGYCPDTYDGLIGVYAGSSSNIRWEAKAQLSGKANDVGQFSAFQLANKDLLSLRISYKLNLKGPAVLVQSTCSTSLVAIHMACYAILNGECDMALAGGVTISYLQKTGYFYQQGLILSPDGHCRAFDAKAKGTVEGNGAGVVVLKRLEGAMADGDHIYAVVKGSAINNDGDRKVGFTAPSVEGQAEIIINAQEMAEVAPESITYVETHGTGTELGDPVEIEALKLAFTVDKKGYCAIGSVKSNLGHLDSASGVAGFIKAVLAIYYRMIPPSLHFEKANPKIDFENSPFYVNTGLTDWSNEQYPLRAGVSAFGIGGTNAHVVLEEWPESARLKLRGSGGACPPVDREYQLIVLSAKTPSALGKMTENLVNYFKNNPVHPVNPVNPVLPDVAYTLQVGRKAFKHRRMLVCSTSTDEEIIDLLSSPEPGIIFSFFAKEENPPVVFMLPGQGSQYVDMALELYKTEPVFHEEMDRCFEILGPLMDDDLKEILYPHSPHSLKINQTEITQPVIFAIEYALAKLLMKWGIKPFAMIGHSIGEYVAACLAGVFSLEDALEIVVLRGQLMQQAPGGSMVSISVSEEELKPILDRNGDLSLAAVNSPSHCTVSGLHEAIDHLISLLEKSGYANRRLHTSHAFHSTLMDPILKRFEEKVTQIKLNKPEIPYISNVTGKWITAGDACDPEYWANHLRRTVRFSDGVKELLKERNSIFVEVGPGKALTTFVKTHIPKTNTRMILNLVRHPREKISDAYFLLKQIGWMWLYGKKIDWRTFHEGTKRHRIPLPGYPFEGQPYWLKGDPLNMIGEQTEPSVITPQTKKKSNIADWFYIPVWELSSIDGYQINDMQKGTKWLVFTNEGSIGSQLVRRLKQDNRDVEIVRIGSEFTRLPDEGYMINPRRDSDYFVLFEALNSMDKIPRRIVHLWNVTEKGEVLEGFDKALDQGFYSLLYLVQAIGKQGLGDKDKVEITVLTNRMQAVTGEEVLEPQKATVRGAVQVISREYPQINCRCIDIDCPEPASHGEDKLLENLLVEMSGDSFDMYAAYRNNQRWVQTFEQAPLEITGQEKPVLKEKGIYLVTGGLGGIGLVLSEYLAKTVKARLILIGRSAFPAPEQWEEWLLSHDTSDSTSRKIRKVRELETLGAEVLVLCADVADIEQMHSAAVRAEERFGTINGIIHSAGLPDGGLIQRRTKEMSDTVFAPKVKGTVVLDTIARNRKWELDFIVLCSSLSAVLAPVGQAAYCAANAFLDSFAYLKNTKGNTFTVSVNWDTWQEVGMAVQALEQSHDTPSVSPRKELNMDHPLFDRCELYDSGREIFVSNLSVNKHWVLAEHRIGGNATLPGTAYLEMARAAVENHAGERTVELGDVYFLTPLTVKEDEAKEVRTVLKKVDDADTYTFSIISRLKAGADQWVEHARGKALVQGGTEPKTYNIKDLEAQCQEKEVTYSLEDASSLAGDMILGPRWDNLKRAKFGENQGFGFLELPGSFAADIDSYKLHPALLDMATSLLRRVQEERGSYLPFYYKKITIRNALPGRSFCYAQPAKKNTPQPGLLIYDITIMDEQGTELVKIEEYTFKKVNLDASKTGEIDEARNFSLQISAPGSFENFEYRPVPRKQPGSGEVEIAVYATGLNFREVLLALGALGPLEPGLTFGLECAGQITACGEGVEGFAVGDEVIAFGTSCFSPYITTPASLAAQKPANLSFAEGASIPVAFITAYYALINLGKLSKGERVLIHSATGGVGMAAVQIARWKGAEIFATAGSKEKRKYLRSLGIQHVMDSRTLDFADEVSKRTDGRGVDVVLNSLSGEFISKSISLLAPYGRFLEIGIRDMLENTQMGLRPFLKGLSYFSVLLSAELPGIEDVWSEVVQHFRNGTFTPLPQQTFPVDEVARAFETMSKGTHIGKIVVTRDSHFPGAASPHETKQNPLQAFQEEALKNGILPGEGVDVFNRILAGKKWPQVVVSTTDLFDRIRESRVLPGVSLIDPLHEGVSSVPKYARPQLSTEYMAPVTEMEKKLAHIWQEFLGFKQVGIHDDFFELGGDSLKAITFTGKIHKELLVELPLNDFFNMPTIKQLAEYIEANRETGEVSESSSINPAEERDYYELSSAQKRLYILHRLEPDSITYNISKVVRLEGELDRERLEEAFQQLIKRHESLRTSFVMMENEPVQRIHDQVVFSMEHGAWSMEVSGFIRPFDLSKPPLLRVGLVEIGDNQYLLIVDIHHIIADGTSMAVIVKDFMTFYGGEQLPRLRLQYKDYSQWQQKEKEGESIKQQERYWLNLFEGEIPLLNLPTDYPRPMIQSFEGNTLTFEIGEDEAAALKSLALKEEITLFMVLLSIYNVLLSKLSRQEDIVVGTPVAARRHADLQQIIGMFVNTLPLRNFPIGEKPFVQFLQQMKERTLAAYENQEYPFEDLVERVTVNRDASRNPLFDVVFSLQNTELPEIGIPGLKLKPYEFTTGTSKFDITLQSFESGKRLIFSLEYAVKLFTKETAERYITYFKNIIASVLENPGKRITDLEMLPEEEKQWLLYEINNTAAEYPGDKTIHQLFEEHVLRTPDHIAIVAHSATHKTYRTYMTYTELNRISDQLASLLQVKGVASGDIVGIMMERSIEMVVGILAILKGGGVYLPIDPGYPEKRITYILKDSGAKVLLTNLPEGLHSFNCQLLIVNCELLMSSPAVPLHHSSFITHHFDLAYVIFTSGTTGKPKGVLIEHGNVVRLMFNDKFLFDFSHRDVWTLFHSFCFDFSVWEMYGALLYGGKLVIINKMEARDSQGFLEILKENQVTVLNQTPSAFYHLAGLELKEFGKRLNLRYVIFGGEMLTPSRLKEWKAKYPAVKLINMYGITETTVHVTFKEITHREIESNISNIGGPIPTLSTYIMDKQLKLIPTGAAGELTVGGKGVGRGYVNRPELTDEKFEKNPYKPGEKLYCSGDLAKLSSGGDLEYLGRIDSQVKIRGFRIETGEIESRLLSHDRVDETVVIAREDVPGERYLTAYFVLQSEGAFQEIPIQEELKEYLSQTLPDYMIPSYFVQMEHIPLTPNGKVDRKALPEPEVKAGKDYAAPGNEIEEKLVKIWSRVLDVRGDIGIEDDFFRLGGHSLKATVLISQIHKVFNIRVPLAMVFTRPTVRGLALYIKGAVKEEYRDINAVEQKEYYALSSAQKRMYVLQQMEPDSVSYNIPAALTLEGELDRQKLENTFRKLIERHESLRTSFGMVKNEPVQRIHDRVVFSMELGAWSRELGAWSREQGAGSREQGAWDRDSLHAPCPMPHASFIRPFDLSKPPLFRVGLTKVEEEKYLLVVDMHHIISDGTSMGVISREFMSFYAGRELEPLRIQYKDFSHWQKDLFESGKINEQEAYWLGQFEDEIPVLDLPQDYPRPLVQRFEGNTLHFEIGDAETRALRALALKEEITLYMVLLSIYNVWLSKLGGSEDIIVGTPIAGRRHTDLQQVIGVFINTLALRNFPVGEKFFPEFLGEVKERTLSAYENQDYPFEELVEKAGVSRDTARSPLFDILFALQNLERTEINIPGLKLAPYENENIMQIARFDMTLQGFEEEQTLTFTLEYSISLFKKETIARFINYFKKIISSLLEDPGKKIADIEMVPEEEKRRLLYDFNDTPSAYPKDKTIQQLFAEQVARTPDHIAVTGHFSGYRSYMTYTQLNQKSNQLSYWLQKRGAASGDIVGLLMERSGEMIIGILAILKAGGAYLPLDPDYPQERITYMLKDSGAKVLLTNLPEGHLLFNCQLSIVNCQLLMSPPEAPLHHSSLITHNSGSLAYVIYTSGTTGRPKGVMVTNRNVVRLVKHTNYVEFREGDRLLQTGALEFDASTFEIWGMLLNGLTLYLVSKEKILNPAELKEAVSKYGISTMWMTSPLFNQMLQADIEIFEGLKNLLVGGDVLSPVHINRLKQRYPRLNVINGYGPTENTTFSTTFRIDREYTQNIPIGTPITNSTAYILDKYNNLQPIGVAGELYVGGDGLALGYLNNPELTNSKFKRGWHPQPIRNYKAPVGFPLRFSASQLLSFSLYRTGDLARWLPDPAARGAYSAARGGYVIEFIGRIDHQVKLRGFRVELGEIENRLLKHEDIKEAVVIVKEELARAHRFLVAYIVLAQDKTLGVPELREYLAIELPDYMIPTYFVQLEKMPLTPNGKIDRRALPGPDLEVQGDDAVPTNATEKKLAEIWSEVLGIEEGIIGINADFFELGGHSLRATVLAAEVHKAFNVKIPLAELFTRPTIRGLSLFIKEAAADRYRSIYPAEKKEYYILTSAQKRLYVLQQMDPDSVGYNMPGVLILEGKLDQQALEDTFRQIIMRHESLRTSFFIVNNEPVQKIHDHAPFEIEYYNSLNPRFIRSFDLSLAPLLRVGLIKVVEEEHLLMIDMHHIISDGTSMGVVAKEFMALYEGKELEALGLHYKDYAEWQHTGRQKGVVKEQEAYWLGQFDGEVPVINLPYDYPRPAVQSFKGSIFQFEVGEETAGKLRTLASVGDATLYMVLLAVYNVWLSRLGGGVEDVIIGTPVAARRHVDLQQVTGMFVNTMALRNYPSADKTCKEFLKEVKERTLRAFENQEYPFEELVERVPVERNASRNPLFDVMFVLQNIENVAIEIPGLKLKPYDYETRISKFDLTLIGVEEGEKLSFTVEYCTKLFKEETIQRFAGYFKEMIHSVLEEPARKISHIEILPQEEKRRLLFDFNDTAFEYPVDKTIHMLFEEQARQTPDGIAVNRTYSVYMTYDQLHKKSNQMVYQLQAKGVNPGSIVAILLDRSIEMIMALLAVLKSGAAYLPIDPDYPQERIDYMLADSGAAILVSKGSRDIELVDIRKSIGPIIHGLPNDLCYIIYTSGSTGRPKGVLVGHRGVVNLVYYHRHVFGEGAHDRMSQVANPGFDAMAFEVWPCLLCGAALVIADEETRLDPAKMKQWLIEQGITISFQPTVMAEQLLDETWPREGVALRALRTAGDKLTRFPGRSYPFILYNLYGPTEDTVWSTWTEVPVKPEPGVGEVPTIGKPVGNHRVYILSANSELQPIGVPGELCISGAGVARGYLNNPELTNSKFQRGWPPLRFSASQLLSFSLYHTGDLARWLPDPAARGAYIIEFLGRLDNQVKLRGFRIELGEIENQLTLYDGIKEAVVILRKERDHQPYICAYFVSDSEPLVSELRDYLSKGLPAYMIPAYCVQLDKIPLTANGKVDRRSLPEPEFKVGEDYEAPGTFIEKKLAETWQQVLGVEPIGINDNFFEMGGDSIKGVQIASRLQKYGLKLQIADLFLHPFIKQLARCVRQMKRMADQGIAAGDVLLTPIQKWFFENVLTHRHHFNQAIMLYREEGFDENIVNQVFKEIITHHDALRMVFEVNHEGERVVQRNRGLEGKLFEFEVFDFQSKDGVEKEIEQKANRIQATIDLETGPLVHLGLFKTAEGDHLLIVVHHLVIDGVSWRILLEDFAVGYRQAMKGETVQFQAKTDSFQQWAQRLREYAENETLLNELEYWKQVETGDTLPVDAVVPDAQKRVKNSETVNVVLDVQETRKLLGEVHRAYGTEINDILLAAMCMAFKEWGGIEKVSINLEGHGREGLMEDVDISRTVGWFTSQYPVLFNMTYAANMSYLLKQVKETLRQVPNKGAGYSILKYLTQEDKKQGIQFNFAPEINFNYLGDFGIGLDNDLFQMSEKRMGNTISPELEKKAVFDINGLIADGKLRLSVSYNKYEYKQQTVERLVEGFKSHLLAIIEHCVTKEEKELTPSDLTYPGFTIDELDALIRKKGDILDAYELTPMQSGMLFHSLQEQDSTAYFQQTVFSIEGDVDIELLQKSFNRLIERYDVLRILFYYEHVDQPVQILLKHNPIDIHFQDILRLNEEEQGRYLQEFYIKDRERGFDLSSAVLTRLSLLKTGRNSYKLVWSFHHILMDGWCLSIVFHELLHIYRGLRSGETVTLPIVTQYREYIHWLRRQDMDAGLRFWRDYLEGYEEQAVVPKTRELLTGSRYQPEEYRFQPDDVLLGRLREMAAENRVTLNTVMQTVWSLLLQRYNNAVDVVFGAVTAGRPSEIQGIESMVGLFINTVPVRIKAEGETIFTRLLRETQETALLARFYEYLALADIQANSFLKETLIQHIMVFENYPLEREVTRGNKDEAVGFEVTGLEAFEQTNYDFNIVIAQAEHLLIKFNYNGLAYDRDFVEQMACHFENILRQVGTNPEIVAKEIAVISEAERHQLLLEFNDTECEYPRNKTIHQLFEEQARRTPDVIAIHMTYRTYITYDQLNKKSNHLAHLLRERGVASGDIVGIKIERSLEMIIGIYGILKAGGAYLPIDPVYPEERIEYILKDSRAVVLLKSEIRNPKFETNSNDQNSNDQNKQIPIIVLNFEHLNFDIVSDFDIRASNLGPSGLCYVIYTSGTTGKPKGTMIEHHSLVNRLNWMQKHYPLAHGDTLLQKTPFTFDVSVWEIFWWSMMGAGLCLLVPGGEKDPGVIVDTAASERVTMMHFVPSMLSVFLDYLEETGRAGKLSALKQVIASGEALTVAQVNRFKEILFKENGTKLANLYGPTEATVDVSYYDCFPSSHEGTVPIGMPIDNIGLYVMNQYMQPQPVGIPGELCIGGVGLARGYLNRPELTNSKFQRGWHPLRFSASQLLSFSLYRTGDLARWLPGGNIEFLGRIDLQVKIRGYRIELGEIENQLLQHEAIKEAVVITKEDDQGDCYLCAYVVTVKDLDTAEIREYLSQRLPDYMIPSYFVFIDTVPLTPNGKLDRKVLPSPVFEAGKHYTAPRSETEKKLVEIWSEILGVDKGVIGIDHNFFELGGHSLKATMLMSRVHKHLNIKIPLNQVFKTPTIRGLSEYITGAEIEKYTSISPVEKKEYYGLSASQQRLYMLQQLKTDSIIYNMPDVVMLEGEINKEKLENTFHQLIHRHESLRTCFIPVQGEVVQKVHGPGDVVFEIECYENSRSQFTNNIINDFIKPFDLSQAPLLRVGLIKVEEEAHILMVDMHHIISDGTSHALLVEEFMTLYGQEELPPLKVHYKDYAEWQNTGKAARALKSQEEYWLKQLEGEIPVLNLPTDFDRPSVMDFEGSTIDFEINPEESKALKRIALEEGVSLFGLVLALMNVFIARVTGQEDIVIGTQVAGRRHADLQHIIGVFLNTLVLRNHPHKEKTFGQFLDDVMAQTLEAFENQEYQFEDLVERLLGKRAINRNPLFDVMLVWQNFETEEIRIPGLTLKPYPWEHKSRALLDLSLYGSEAGEKLLFTFEYSTELFKKETVERFITYFKEIVSCVIADKEVLLKDIQVSHDLGAAVSDVFREEEDAFGF